MGGTHTFEIDERNEHVKIYVNGEIVPRKDCMKTLKHLTLKCT